MRRRLAKRGVLSASPETKVIVQSLAVDEFGEVAGRKREARKQATKRGHVLGPWHRRPNDPSGRFNAFCQRCNRVVVVATEQPEDIKAFIYGHALTEKCGA